MITQYLDVSAAAVIAKITTALFPVVTFRRLKLYFQPASESPKTVSLIVLEVDGEDGIQLDVV